MMARRSQFLATLICTLLLAPVGSAQGEDWPSWRGPQRDGICRETGLLKEWPKDGPKLAWKTGGIGGGFGGPAIVGKTLYIMTNLAEKEQVLALDVSREGKQIWATMIQEKPYEGAGHPGTRSTPTIDVATGRLYTLGINGDLVCLDTKDGKILWRHDLVKDFGGSIPKWGYAESVLLDGPWIVCTPGGPKGTILALDKDDGKVVWQAKGVRDGAEYSSIVKFTAGDVKQYVTLTKGGVIAVRAADGQFLWRYEHAANHIANVTTCVTHKQAVFGASAYGNGGGLVWVQKTADGFNAKEMYFSKQMQNHHGGLILWGRYLYGASQEMLTCLDIETGNMKWRDRTPGKCSLLCAEGLLYCRDEKGPISLVEATPAGFRLKGRFNQPDRSERKAWPHLVIANGMLYVRDQDLLLCYDVRAEK